MPNRGGWFRRSAFHRSDLQGAQHLVPGTADEDRGPFLQLPFQEKCVDDDPLLCIGEEDLWHRLSA